jgi:hypothetical protein
LPTSEVDGFFSTGTRECGVIDICTDIMTSGRPDVSQDRVGFLPDVGLPEPVAASSVPSIGGFFGLWQNPGSAPKKPKKCAEFVQRIGQPG